MPCGFEETKYVGAANYRRLLEDDKIKLALENTIVYTVNIVPATWNNAI